MVEWKGLDKDQRERGVADKQGNEWRGKHKSTKEKERRN